VIHRWTSTFEFASFFLFAKAYSTTLLMMASAGDDDVTNVTLFVSGVESALFCFYSICFFWKQRLLPVSHFFNSLLTSTLAPLRVSPPHAQRHTDIS
jgi:hypothetical protein